METVTDQNLDEVLKTEKLLIIKFGADWCSPCRMIDPTLNELHTEYGDEIIIGKLNVDENPETSAKYGIRSIPTILFIKNGVIVDKMVGAAPKVEFVKRIEANK